MKLSVSLTTSLGKGKTIPDISGNNPQDIYTDLVKKTAATAKKLGLSHIELVSFPPFNANVLESAIDELKPILSGFELSFHLPAWEVNPAALNEGIRKAALQEQKAIIDFACKLKIKQFCMHPASFGAMRWAYGWFIEDIKKEAKKSFLDIQSYCDQKRVKLNVENLPLQSMYFTKPNHFKGYVGKKTGLVIDTAHAITVGINPTIFLKQYSSFVQEIHAVDGFSGKPDSHPPLGEGEIDFKEFFNQLKKMKFKGPVVIEMMSEADAQQSLEYLKKIEAI